MAADAPQSGGGYAGTDGGHPTPFGGFDGVTPVRDVSVSQSDLAIDNRIQDVDITRVAVDPLNDGDYDDPYPGGKSDSMNPAVPLG